MNLFAKLSLDAGGFNNPLAGARGALASFKEGLTGIVAPMLTVQAALAGIREGFALVRSAIDEAAQMEDFETAFVTLLGSTRAARERLAELTEFAKTTPFELPDVVAASRILQAFTGDALGSGEGLRLVGDAAAAVGRPLRDVDLWMGRLFSALRDGLPVGEPIQNLTQLGLITGEVRKQLVALQGNAQGEARTMELLGELFGRNAGSMERLSQTLHGRISNLRDMWGQLKRDFGEPIVDALKPFIMEITALLERLRPIARNVGEAVAVVMQAFTSGNLKELSMLSLKVGFGEAVNFLWRQLVVVFTAVRTLLSDPGFWSSVGKAILDAIMGVKSALAPKAGGSSTDERLRPFFPGWANWGIDKIQERWGSGNSVERDEIPLDGMMWGGSNDPKNAIGELIAKAWKDAMAAGGGADLFDTSGATAALKELVAALKKQLADSRPDVTLDQEAPSTDGGGGTGKKSSRGGQDALSDRLARIGGFIGPAGGPGLEYARRTADNTAKTEKAARDTVVALNTLRTELGLV